MIIHIPAGEEAAVAAALRKLAVDYRADTGHDPDDVTALRASADRLDGMADELEAAIAAPPRIAL